MKKEEYIEKLPGELPKEDIKKIEDFFFNYLSANAQAKPRGNIKNYIFFHKDLSWGILRKEGKYGLENTESYELIKFNKTWKFLGMKMGMSSVTYVSDILTGDEMDTASIKGAEMVSILSDSEKEFLSALKDFNKEL